MIESSRNICVICKGSRRLCGRPVCPILLRFRESVRVTMEIKNRVVYGATPPSLVVGERGYPRISLFPALPTLLGEEAKLYDNPEEWWGNLSLEDIIRLRASMIYPSIKVHVKRDIRRSNVIDEIQWMIVSTKPVESEITLSRNPVPTLRFDEIIKPIGPSAPLTKLRVVGNPSVPKPVERVVSSLDIRARDAVIELYKHGVSIYDIIRLFSAGALGMHANRRIVPTRWSITAVDNIVGDYLLSKVKTFDRVDEVLLFHAEYLGNHFEIILLPQSYSFEMIEVWLPGSVWTGRSKAPVIVENYELWDGRCRGPMDGGYYAIRTGILEGLMGMRRQATVVVVREVRPEYFAPVGNWHIRESIRRAFNVKPEKPSSFGELLRIISRRLKVDVGEIVSRSRIFRMWLCQEKLTKYIKP